MSISVKRAIWDYFKRATINYLTKPIIQWSAKYCQCRLRGTKL